MNACNILFINIRTRNYRHFHCHAKLATFSLKKDGKRQSYILSHEKFAFHLHIHTRKKKEKENALLSDLTQQDTQKVTACGSSNSVTKAEKTGSNQLCNTCSIERS